MKVSTIISKNKYLIIVLIAILIILAGCLNCYKTKGYLEGATFDKPNRNRSQNSDTTTTPSKPTVATSEKTLSKPTIATSAKTTTTTTSAKNRSIPTTATSMPTTATSKPTTATSMPTTATSRPTTATSMPTTATSRPTTATSRPTTATSRPTTATSMPTTATSMPTPATSIPTTAKTTSKPTITLSPQLLNEILAIDRKKLQKIVPGIPPGMNKQKALFILERLPPEKLEEILNIRTNTLMKAIEDTKNKTKKTLDDMNNKIDIIKKDKPISTETKGNTFLYQ